MKAWLCPDRTGGIVRSGSNRQLLAPKTCTTAWWLGLPLPAVLDISHLGSNTTPNMIIGILLQGIVSMSMTWLRNQGWGLRGDVEQCPLPAPPDWRLWDRPQSRPRWKVWTSPDLWLSVCIPRCAFITCYGICILHHVECLLVLLIVFFEKSKIIRLRHHIPFFLTPSYHLHYSISCIFV